MGAAQEIFREVAAAVDERLFAPMDEVILAHSALQPRQRVREAMRRHFERYREEARKHTPKSTKVSL